MGIVNGCGRIWDHCRGLGTPFVIVRGWLLLHTLHPLHNHHLKFIMVLLEHCVMFFLTVMWGLKLNGEVSDLVVLGIQTSLSSDLHTHIIFSHGR